jgi:hypothetical protein
MKKIFTLTLGLMLTMAMFAAGRKPMVTITSAKRYQIVIDGRSYLSNGNAISISNLFNGQHDIKVYKVRPGVFMSSKRLVASSDFQLRNSDVKINIDRFGQMQITESGFGRDWNDHDNGWKKSNDYSKGNDHGYGRHQENQDRRF